jgi:hypothetical protein
MPNKLSFTRPTFSYLLLPVVLFMALSMTGCGKDSAAGSGNGAAGSDQLAPGATPNQSEIDRIKAQRMPPANLANQRPAGGAPGGGAPYGAPGGGTTYFKGGN